MHGLLEIDYFAQKLKEKKSVKNRQVSMGALLSEVGGETIYQTMSSDKDFTSNILDYVN